MVDARTDTNPWALSLDLTPDEIEQMRVAHRDSWPVGNSRHGTPANPTWGTYCVECGASWPCDVARLLHRLDCATGD